MKTAVIIILLLIIIYLLLTYILFLLICRKISNFIFPMSKIIEKTVKPYKDIVKVGKDFIKEKNKNKEIKDVYIKSDDGLKLHGMLIEKENPKGIIIEVHGYRSNVQNDLYASCHEYYNMGYSLLLVDNRTSNKSEGKYITFGIKESRDLINWIKFVNEMYPNKKIVLAGISMGATTILMSLKNVNKNMNIKCILVDSGFISPYDEVLYYFKHYLHINGKIFIYMIDVWCKLFAKFSLKEENTLDCIKKSRYPILFVHGLNDDFVPVINTKTNYNNYKGKKEMALFENATHGISYLVDKERYIKYIKKFID